MLRFWSRFPPFASIEILLLLGCVECRAQSAAAEASSAPILPANTPVILRLKESLYKKDAKPGQPVEFEVGFDVVVNGEILIQSGAAVNGTVRQVDQAGKGPANVVIDLGTAQTISGELVRLTSAGTMDDASPGRPRLKDVGGIVAFDPEVLPALPLIVPVLAVMELVPGKKVLLHKDTEEFARVAESQALDAAKLNEARVLPLANIGADALLLCIAYHAAVEGPGYELTTEEINSSSARPLCSILVTAYHLHAGGDLDGAIKQYQQALSLDSTSFVHFQIASLFQEKRDLVHAIPEYRAAVQLDPKDARSQIGFANALEQSGNLDDALAECGEALRVQPDNAYLHYLLGRLLVKKNDPDAAIVELQWALKKERNHFSQANCELGRAYELKGDLKAALRQYRTAYRAHADDEQCRAAYQRLKLQLKQ